MQTKIRGNLQIQAGTILDAQIASGANIDVTKLNKTVLTPDIGSFTLTAVLDFGSDFAIRSSASPFNEYDITNKSYVDAVGAGFGPKLSCRVSTTENLTVTYDNGTNGLGATLTNSGTNAALELDGVSLTTGDRALVRHQTNSFENGIYIVTTVGDGGTPWVLTRAEDFDNNPAEGEIKPGAYTFILAGTEWSGYGFTQVAFDSGDTIGTDAITFTEFSNPTDLIFGTGLTNSGGTVNLDDTSVTGGSYGSATSVASFTVDAQGRLTAASNTSISITDSEIAEGANISDSKLAQDYIQTSEVDGSTIEFSGGSLNVVAGGITATELATDSVTTIKILDANVTNDKLAGSISDDKLIADYIQTSEVDGSTIEFSASSLSVIATLQDIYNNSSGDFYTIDTDDTGLIIDGDPGSLNAILTVTNSDCNVSNDALFVVKTEYDSINGVDGPTQLVFYAGPSFEAAAICATNDDWSKYKELYISVKTIKWATGEAVADNKTALELKESGILNFVTGSGNHFLTAEAYASAIYNISDAVPNVAYVDAAIQTAQVQIEDNGGIRDDGSGIKIDFGIETFEGIFGTDTIATTNVKTGSYYVGSQSVFYNGSYLTESIESPSFSDGDYLVNYDTGEITFENNLVADDIVVVRYYK